MATSPLAALRDELRQLRTSRPGERFEDGWTRRRQSPLVVRLSLPLLGLVLVLAGVVMLVVPGPGLVGIVLGLAVASSSVRPVARRLDRAEVWLQRQWHRVPPEVRQSRAAKVGALLVLACGAGAAMFTTWWVGNRLL